MSRLGSLQVLRAIAALSVALLHFQTEAMTMASARRDGFAPLLLDHLGAGVDLFFVISGFVMVYASTGLFERQGAAGAFLTRRIARIVPLYWAMTTLFVAVLLLSPSALSTGGVTPLEVIKSYVFIPYVANGTGLMQPVYKLGWTLNYEMTFYLAFSLFLFLPMEKAVLRLVGLLSLMVIAGRMLLPAPGALAFWTDPIILEFAFGALLGLAYLKGIRIGLPAGAGLVVSGLTMLAASPYLGQDTVGPMRPLLWGFPGAMVLAGALLVRREEGFTSPSRGMAFLEKMGDASYAIYLVHPWVFRGLSAVWQKSGLSASVHPWLYVCVGIIILIPLSILIYEYFERPLTKTLKHGLLKRRQVTQPTAL